MIVVPVLITSCHVSLKPKIGPVTSQTTMMATANVNTRGRPQKWAAAFANPEYQAVVRICPHHRAVGGFVAGSERVAEAERQRNLHARVVREDIAVRVVVDLHANADVPAT